MGYGIGWPAELWTGTIVLSSLMGLLIAFLLVLTRFPTGADPARRDPPLAAGADPVGVVGGKGRD